MHCLDGTTELTCTDGDCSGVTVLVVQESAHARVILPTLATADEIRIAYNAALTTVSLPRLKAAGLVGIWGNSALRSLNLPALTTGVLAIDDNSSLAVLELPALAEGAVRLYEDAALTTVDLPVLVVAHALDLVNDEALINVNLPALTTGALYVFNVGLTTLSLPSLKTVPESLVCDTMACSGGLAIKRCPALARIDLPALAQAGSVVVEDNPALTSLAAPALAAAMELGLAPVSAGHSPASVRSPLLMSDYGGLRLARNGSLSSLGLPSLSAASAVIIDANASLALVSLPSLARVQSFTFTDNPAYPQCAAEAVLAQLASPPQTVDVSGNDSAASCAP